MKTTYNCCTQCKYLLKFSIQMSNLSKKYLKIFEFNFSMIFIPVDLVKMKQWYSVDIKCPPGLM